MKVVFINLLWKLAHEDGVKGYYESECPTPQGSPLILNSVMIVQQKQPLKWRRAKASVSSSCVNSQKHPEVQPLPTPPSTAIKGNGVATQSNDAWPTQPNVPLSKTSSGQSLTSTVDVKKKRQCKGRKRPIWELEPVVEWLEDNLDGSVFIDRLWYSSGSQKAGHSGCKFICNLSWSALYPPFCIDEYIQHSGGLSYNTVFHVQSAAAPTSLIFTIMIMNKINKGPVIWLPYV